MSVGKCDTRTQTHENTEVSYLCWTSRVENSDSPEFGESLVMSHVPHHAFHNTLSLTLAGRGLNAACSEGAAAATHSWSPGEGSCRCWSRTGRTDPHYSGNTLCTNRGDEEEEEEDYRMFKEGQRASLRNAGSVSSEWDKSALCCHKAVWHFNLERRFSKSITCILNEYFYWFKSP